MGKYRKKPIVIEAYQTDKEIIIHTLEGNMKADIGDYIITGVNGEQYPCKPDIFDKTYEKVLDDKGMPSVQPKTEEGHWIRVDKTKVKCSQCEITHLIAQYPSGRIDYCPNCGARMNEVSE